MEQAHEAGPQLFSMIKFPGIQNKVKSKVSTKIYSKRDRTGKQRKTRQGAHVHMHNKLIIPTKMVL